MTTAKHRPRIDVATGPRWSPRLWLALSLLVAAMTTSAADLATAPTGEPAARLDLQTSAGVAAVRGAWRYADAELVPTMHRAPEYTRWISASDRLPAGYERSMADGSSLTPRTTSS